MKKTLAMLLTIALVAGMCLCGAAENAGATTAEARAAIEEALNLKNNPDQAWSYDAENDAWTLSIVAAVTAPVIPDEEGVSVCVPGAYVRGIDTDGDGAADVTAADYRDTANGSLVIDGDATVTSTHGQVYTAATAPVILNTGAAGYGNASNTLASATYAKEGYINVACGNRGKQDSYTDSEGKTVYTGDAPSCLADQKAAARFVKYNILLGNLPGSVYHWVSTGGSGGGAHAVMFAATSNHPDFYDYQIAVGAVGVYRNADGTYDTTVTIDGQQVSLSDGTWGCVAYSPITSLYEADMAMAFEYSLDPDHTFNTDFQKALAGVLAGEYMDYINGQNIIISEGDLHADIDGDGLWNTDDIALTITFDADTNTYGGTYVDLYRAKFIGNLESYLSGLDYAEGWTWFDAEGKALTDEVFAAMTLSDKVQAFLEGRYDRGSSRRGGMMGGRGMGPSGMNGKADFTGERPEGMAEGMPEGMMGGNPGNLPGAGTEGSGDQMAVGTPDQGTTQASGSTTDSKNYASYDDMLSAYKADIEAIQAGDAYGRNIVDLYNPLNYIGAEGTWNPAWMVMLCGAAEGDISMLNSLNLEIAACNAGIDASTEWQWDGGHVPSEIFGSSLAMRVDFMYGYEEGAAAEPVEIERLDADLQTANGAAEAASGTDITGWVTATAEDHQGDTVIKADFTTAAIAAYRTNGASKATPGFDVIDYGQEDYVFGSAETDARHWSEFVLKALTENRETLEPLFNKD